MGNLTETIKRNPSVGWGLLLAVSAVVLILAILAAGITETRAQIASVFNNIKQPIRGEALVFAPTGEAEPAKEGYEVRKVKIVNKNDIDGRNDQWGINYQRQYDTWKKTRETDFKSKHLGNVVKDELEYRPDMVVLWAGYAFARDYLAPRGHWYALTDMRKSLRTGAPGVAGNKDMQAGTCWTCKSPDVPRLMSELGIGEYYIGGWSELGHEVVNPIGCGDCHNPKTMDLTITRPALVEAFKRLPESDPSKSFVSPNVTEFLKRINGDVTKASPNEMRSLVCAQCHIEYYFDSYTKHILFPWDFGLTVEDMEKFYDRPTFTVPGKDGPVSNQPYFDWIHTLSKAPMIKTQHPDWEVYLLGTHGKRGVACADCHLPFKSEGGMKYSDHQIMSPLKNIAGTCGNCHRDSEANLRAYVEDNQDRVNEIRNRVEPELVKAHLMTEALLKSGKLTETSDEIKVVHKLLRQAQWRWDFGVAGHGNSFHSPVETARILAASLDKTRLAQLEAQKLLMKYDVTFTMPDVSTKAKAQAYIGLNMDKLRADKDEFMKTVVPGWIEKAKQNNRLTEPGLIDEYK